MTTDRDPVEPAVAERSGWRARYPATPRRPVVDTYHGVAVVDDYRWLEHGSDPEVKAWSDAQNALARAYLDALPSQPILRARIRELLGTSPRYAPTHYVGGRLFVLKFQPPLQQRLLVTYTDPSDPASERVVVDPNALDANGSVAIDWYVPSLDGRLVAVSLSQGGSEDGTLHVFDVLSGGEAGDVIPRVQYGTAGGSVAWLQGSTALLYTRYPHRGERPDEDLNFYQQVWRHDLGTPIEADRYVVGREFPRIAEVHLESSADGSRVAARVAHGDGGDCEWWLSEDAGAWSRLATIQDRIVGGRFGGDGALWVRSLKGAPRGSILRLPPSSLTLDAAQVVVPEGADVIVGWDVADTRLYVAFGVGGPSVLRAYDLAGNALGEAPSEPVSSILGPLGLDGDEVLYGVASYVAPDRYVRWTAGGAEAKPTALSSTSPADFSDTEVLREVAISKDGTRVPLTILRRRGTALDGANPTLLYGYGGYGLSLTPAFNPVLRAWIEQGGVYAEANLRGGGEYGEEWHRAGNLTRKQNVFDDFIACAEELIRQGYCRPATLAIHGASNGGLLIGAALTQRPDLFRAVEANVGDFDSLRVETDDNGAFNVTEFGSTAEPEQFRALYAYSPYHRVVDGVAYPAVMCSTGANDPRVDPYHSRKVVARLQAASGSDRPVLLRTTDRAGHGMGSSLDETVALRADIYAFLLDQLGVEVS